MSGFSSIPDFPSRLYSRAANLGHGLTGAGKASSIDQITQFGALSAALTKIAQEEPLTRLELSTLLDLYENLATAAKEGRLTKADSNKLDAILKNSKLRKHFFAQPVVQRKLVKALMMGNDLHQDIIKELKECTPNLSAEAQGELFDQKFLWMMDGLESRMDNFTALRFFTKLDGDRQNKLINAFYAMPKKVAGDYKGFDWTGRGAAAYANTFNARIRFELARNLSIFSDPQAQKTVVEMLDSDALSAQINLQEVAQGIVGLDPNQVAPKDLAKFPVLDAAINNLDHLNPKTKQTMVRAIVYAIAGGKWELGADKLAEVAAKITPPERKEMVGAIVDATADGNLALGVNKLVGVIDQITTSDEKFQNKAQKAMVLAMEHAIDTRKVGISTFVELADSITQSDAQFQSDARKVVVPAMVLAMKDAIADGTLELDVSRLADVVGHITQFNDVDFRCAAQKVVVQAMADAVASGKLKVRNFVKVADKAPTFAMRVQAGLGLNGKLEGRVRKLVGVANNITTFYVRSQKIVLDALLTVQANPSVAMRKSTMANVNKILLALTNPEAKKNFMEHVAGQLALQPTWLVDASVQSFLVQAIQDGMLEDMVVDTMVANLPNPINHPVAQVAFRKIVLGQSSLPEDVRNAIKAKLPPLVIDEKKIVKRIFAPNKSSNSRDGLFGASKPASPEDVALRMKEELWWFSGLPEEAKNLTSSIVQKLFSRGVTQELAVSKFVEVVDQLTQFDVDVQKDTRQAMVQAMVQVIVAGKLELRVGKLAEVANNITTFDEPVQQIVLNAMLSVDANADSVTRTNAMVNVNKTLSALTNPEAKKNFVRHVADQLADKENWLVDASVQSFFAQAIQDEILENTVVETMVGHLPPSIDNPDAQVSFRKIVLGQSSLPERVRTTIKAKLPPFLVINAQEIVDRVFKVNHGGPVSPKDVALRMKEELWWSPELPEEAKDVTRLVAQKLSGDEVGSKDLEDPGVQLLFAQAIQDGMLVDSAVIRAIVTNLPTAIDDENVQSAFRSALNNDKFSFDDEVKAAVRKKLPVFAADTHDTSWATLAISGVGMAAIAGIQYFIYG